MKPSFYAVAVGKERGIYSTWEQCSAQVTGHRGSIYKSFRTLAEARAFLAAHPEAAAAPSHTAAVASLRLPQVGARRQRDDECDVSELPQASHSSASHTAQRARLEAADSGTAEVTQTRPSEQVVYVDGACSRNGTPHARAGYGGYYGSSSDPRNFAFAVPLSEAQTNNRGELRAVIHCIQQGFADAGMTEDGRVSSDSSLPLRRLVIYTDSRYVIDGLTRYSQKWMRNGFLLASKEPVVNQDLWKQLIQLRDTYNTQHAAQQHALVSARLSTAAAARGSASAALPPPRVFHTHNTRNDETEGVELRHVKGHSNDHGNEMADSLAVKGARLHESQC